MCPVPGGRKPHTPADGLGGRGAGGYGSSPKESLSLTYAPGRGWGQGHLSGSPPFSKQPCRCGLQEPESCNSRPSARRSLQ